MASRKSIKNANKQIEIDDNEEVEIFDENEMDHEGNLLLVFINDSHILMLL